MHVCIELGTKLYNHQIIVLEDSWIGYTRNVKSMQLVQHVVTLELEVHILRLLHTRMARNGRPTTTTSNRKAFFFSRPHDRKPCVVSDVEDVRTGVSVALFEPLICNTDMFKKHKI